MAYLFKNTGLQTTVQMNLTCLVPTDNPEVGRAAAPGAARLHSPLPGLPLSGW